ncbi:MAG: DNA mismatch repair endonuclease MutL [Prevotellaceae bacterium]|jgi:DNA mismatch repair protein MutL|nr:DNA mismatch repair endonuclease MutL [Prevotellaceae bacterium]
MTIKLLPDNVANQIAAGEVVQRPASVVKELMENAVDAKASKITLVIKDAGRTLIQVSDNGSGMSDLDARMAFERHATSKISEARDLERISTFGFRGEALASIAAVAEVELKTRREDDELGTLILIRASTLVTSESCQCSPGSNFAVKNLFYALPARRKFLKSDAVEMKHIVGEFQRVAICNPQIAFTFNDNGEEIYTLPKANLKQRIVDIFGKGMSNMLIDTGVDTTIINLSGFVGKPERARRNTNEQFFFVNNRYFRSPYLQKAVQKAYEQLMPADVHPSFFLYIEIDPSKIDVNIHPSKTEIKFDNEQAIWQIINAAVRESLSRFAIAPSLDFGNEHVIDIPVLTRNTQIKAPSIRTNKNYNPFNSNINTFEREEVSGWENLFANFDEENSNISEQSDLFADSQNETAPKKFLQIKGKYILTSVKSGVLLIDIYRAHQRILYEEYLHKIDTQSNISNPSLFAHSVELDTADFILMQSILEGLKHIGFNISTVGNNTLVFHAYPAGIESEDPQAITEEMLKMLRDEFFNEWTFKEQTALSIARVKALKQRRTLAEAEMQNLFDRLFACATPDISADGKPTLTIISTEELETKLLKN